MNLTYVMDIVHHAIIGGIGSIPLMNTPQYELAGILFLAGSVMPDVDIAFMVFGKKIYLKYHQTITHSIFFPLFLCVVMWFIPLFHYGNFFINCLFLTLGILFHIFCDYLNTFGVQFLYPFIKKKYSSDLIFFIDFILLFLSGFFLLLGIYTEYKNTSVIYFILFLGYVGFKFYTRKKVKKMIDATYIIPSSFNPFEFFIYQNKQKQSFLYNILSEKKSFILKELDLSPYEHIVKQSNILKDMKFIAKQLSLVNVETQDNFITLIYKDIAIRNFGGKFAATTIIYDTITQKIISEYVHI